ncbi:uncharacterized protein LTR77_004897 [Saxophila tyrrhenica]|uniref:Uncharacterized protein n=1 Tax=Saxophila tyrrhenica TaxID=1690608 RepID=A0AAV9PEJ5_9PEZI|nr:hypothetical protein LTR77_004897 [Saxophila tyrrhenica]
MENRSRPSTSNNIAATDVGKGRLARAKSTSSAQSWKPATNGSSTQVSHGQHRDQRSASAARRHPRQQNSSSHSTTGYKSSDPAIARQQAETAAVEAYLRAQPEHETGLESRDSTQVKLQRRRSRVSGRMEGGHFEEAKLGRRKSGGKVKKETGRHGEAASTTAVSGRMAKTSSAVPPSSSQSREGVGETLSVPATTDRGRKRQSQSGYSDGSPMPRHQPTVKQRSSTSQMASSYDGSSDFQRSSGMRTAPTYHGYEQTTSVPQVPRRPDRSAKTGDAAVAQARDKCLQDFQQKKLRERKSMILAPFQKLRTGNTTSSRTSGFDTSLPPFNYADEDIPMPSSSPPPPPAPSSGPVYTIPVHERKSRSFTESIKGRFMKAFRKPSRVPSGLPAQHVAGKTFQFTTTTPSSSSDIVPTTEEDPFVAPNQYLAPPIPRPGSAVSKRTTNTTAKSRVTSWTNSTVAGTWSTRSEAVDDIPADEHGRLKRSDSVSTLRKAKSFFGRPIQNKLRRPSRAQLQNCEESTGLYSALQEQINPSDSASQAEKNDDTLNSRTSSALATLPSQQRPVSTLGSSNRRTGPTIRSVTPDPTAYKLDIPSPVEEVLSPDAAPPSRSNKSGNDSDTPRSQLQRRPAMKAPTPSKEQLARRMERSKNRWQSPLDEMSPDPAPRYNHAAMDDNPYELRSPSRTLHQPPAESDALPHHARVVDEQQNRDTRAEQVLSPSVYSRATDGASPGPDTPVDQGGMMITITGREVRSYSISPQKREAKAEKPVLASGEWRRWLSNEWKGWHAAEALTLPKTILADAPPTTTTGLNERVQSRDTDTPPLQAPPLEHQQPKRPRPRSSRSSFMNERYPMVESARTSMDTRKMSSGTGSRPTSSGMDARVSGATVREEAKMETPVEERPGTVLRGQRVVSRYACVLGLGAGAQITGDDKTSEPAQPYASTQPVEQDATTSRKTSNPPKARSAFDLRANYKNRHNGNIRTIPINRHQNPSSAANHTIASSPIHILEDTTIRNISAGPYAQAPPSPLIQQSGNKENEAPSPPENHGLPAVSSSEWLAAGTSKAKAPRHVSTAQAAGRQKSVSRYSPVRKVTGGASPGGGGSPGQRLVTSWLDGKASKENSPAFV